MIKNQKSQSSFQGSRIDNRHAATLLITVLLTVVAATIAVFTIKVIIGGMVSDSTKLRNDKAISEIRSSKGKILAQLKVDPYAPYKVVLDGESSRRCLLNGLSYAAGAAWPSFCGTGWDYPSGSNNLKVELLPYNSITGTYPTGSLIIRIGFKDSIVTTGYEAVLLPGGRLRPVLYSGSNLSLANIQGGSSASRIDGVIYTNGTLTPSSTPNLTGSYLMTESSFGSSPTDTSLYYARTTSASGPPVINNIRSIIPEKFNQDSVRSLSAGMYSIACPADTSTTAGNITLNSLSYTSTLCIIPGGYVRTTSNTTVQVPVATGTVLFIPAASGANTIDIYTHSGTFDPNSDPVNLASSCATACVTTARTQTQGGSNPGGLNYWTKIATSYIPASGLVGSSITSFLGLCNGTYNGTTSTGFLSSTGTCDIWSGSSQGVEIQKPFTLVVGSAASPVDLYISGPINNLGNNRAGAIVSGDLLIPYWSRPALSSYNLNVDLSVVVVGRSTSAPISFYPSIATSNSSNNSGQLNINGSVGSVSLSFGSLSTLFSSWKITTTSITHNYSAPFMSIPNLTWVVDSNKRLAPTDQTQLFN